MGEGARATQSSQTMNAGCQLACKYEKIVGLIPSKFSYLEDGTDGHAAE